MKGVRSSLLEDTAVMGYKRGDTAEIPSSNHAACNEKLKTRIASAQLAGSACSHTKVTFVIGTSLNTEGTSYQRC